MDMGIVRGLITAALLMLFIGLWAWAWRAKRRKEFDAASKLPLEDGDRPPQHGNNKEKQT